MRSTPLSRATLVLATLALAASGGRGATTVNFGSVDLFGGPGDLDLDGSFLYAINFSANDPVRTVNGVAFTPDTTAIPGATLVGPNTATPWQTKPEFGTTVDDNALEEILHDIRWANSGAGQTLEAHLEVSPGAAYQLQILISANLDHPRNWDIEVEGAEAVDEISALGLIGTPYFPNQSVVYSHSFVAGDGVLDIRMGNLFGANEGGDRNPIWQALILKAEIAADDPTPPGPGLYETSEDARLILGAADGVLANDGPGGGLRVTTADRRSAQGAAVSVAADGSFIYDPTGVAALRALAGGAMVDDTFTYTATNLVPAPSREDGLMSVQVINTVGSNPGNDTAAWLAVWDALDLGAGPTGQVAGGNIANNTSDTETLFDYAGGGGNYGVNNSIGSIAGDGPGGGGGPFGGGDNYSIRGRAFLRFTTGGTYTIGMGSDDGRRIELTEAVAGSAPGYNGFTSSGGQVNGGFLPGDTILGFSGGTGHDWTVGVFDVAAGDILELDAFYYEGVGGDSGEIAIASGAFNDWNGGDFFLLEDGAHGIVLSSVLPLETDTATVTVRVNGTDQVLGADLYQTTEDAPISIGAAEGVLADDPPGTLIVGADTESAQGAAVDVDFADGSFTYDPRGASALQALDQGAMVSDTFTYTVPDLTMPIAPPPVDGLMNVQVVNTIGSNPGNNTTNWLALWDALDGGAGPTGTVGGFSVQNNTSDTETVFDYPGSGGNYGVNNPIGTIAGDGPGGGPGPFNPFEQSGSNYSIRARAFLRFNNGGTYSIALGSDDGRRIELTEAAPGLAPGYTGFTSQGDQVDGPFSAGDTVIGFDGGTGHNQSVGVFDVAAGDILELDAFYYEGGGGDSGEISIASGSFGSWTNTTDFTLLQDGVHSIDVSSELLSAIAFDTVSRTVTVEVSGLNDQPVANADFVPITEAVDGSPAPNTAAGNVLSNDTDADDASLAVSAVGGNTGDVGNPVAGSYGSVVIGSDGAFTYTLDDTNPAVDALTVGDTLTDTFAYTVTDNHPGGNVMTAGGTLTVTIDGANDSPVPGDDPTPPLPGVFVVDEGGPALSVGAADGLLLNDTDVDGSVVGVSAFDDSGTLGSVLAVDLLNAQAGGLVGSYIDLNEATSLIGNRTGAMNSLLFTLDPDLGAGRSDFVLQRMGLTPTGDAGGVITPRVDFGVGTNVTQGDGTLLDRGGFNSGIVPPWQGLFDDLGLTADMDGDTIGATWSGKIRITTPGKYIFTTRSDDGSVLFINGARVVNNNNFQGMTNRDGAVNLAAGMHDISVGMYEGGGGAGVQASYEGPDTGGIRVIIPPTVLYNDVANPGTFVPGGLRGDYYDLDDTASNGLPFLIFADEYLLNPTDPGDTLVLDALQVAVTQVTGRIDFGSGTEAVAGDGTVLDRNLSIGNPYGGIGVNPPGWGVDQFAGVWDGFILVPESGDYEFTGRSDDHGRVFIDLNRDGDFLDAGELVASKQGGNVTNYSNGPVTLTAGAHGFKAATLEGGAGAAFVVSWRQTAAADGTIDNPALETRSVVAPQYFATAVGGDGSFTYDPDGQFESLGEGATTTDTFTYSVRDDSGATGTATATVTIVGENDPPVARDNAYSTDEDTSRGGNVITDDTGAGADSDIDVGDTLTVSAIDGSGAAIGTTVTLPSGATLNMAADGSFTYDPNSAFESLAAGAPGMDTFEYTLADEPATGPVVPATTDTATVNLAITGVNDAPMLDDSGEALLDRVGELVDPAANPGNTVASIIASVNVPAGIIFGAAPSIDMIMDVDDGAVEGIAVVGASLFGGEWQYRLDGETTWNSLDGAATRRAVLLGVDDWVRFQPRPPFHTTALPRPEITFHAWDQTSGAPGGRADLTAPGATGGSTAFSTATEVAGIDVDAQVDLGLEEVGGVLEVVAGAGINNLIYTFTLENVNRSIATGIEVSLALTLPAGVTFSLGIPSRGGFTYNGTTAMGTWTLDRLGPGKIEALTVVLTAEGSAADGAGVEGTVSLASVAEEDIDPANDSATRQTDVARSVDFAVSQWASADPVVAGSRPGNLTYRARVTNNGPSRATGVALNSTLDLPGGVTVDDVVPSAGSLSDPVGTPTNTWTVGELAPGASAELVLTLSVGASAPGGADLITHTLDGLVATETLANTGDDSSALPVSIERQVDLRVGITESADPVEAGSGPGNLTHTVTVWNDGPSDASGVDVASTLTLPTGVTLDSVVRSASAPPLKVDFNSTNQDNGAHNEAGFQAYDAQHEVSASFVTMNYAALGTTVSVTPAWPNTGDNRVQQMIDRVAAHDNFWTGDNIDLLTDWLGVDTRTGNGGNGNYDGVNGNPTYMTLTLSGVPAGRYSWTSYHHDTENVHAAFVVEIDEVGAGLFTGVGEFQMSSSRTGGNPSNPNRVTGPDAASLDSTVRFDIVSDGVNDIVLRFTPLSQIAVHQQLFGINGFELAEAPEAIGDLAAGASESFDLTFTAGAVAADGAVITHQAAVSAVNETDTDNANDSATETTTVRTFVDLAVTTAASATSVQAGGADLTYTVTVTNNSSTTTATNVTLTNAVTLPAGVRLRSATPGAGSTFSAGTWKVSSLAPGVSNTLRLVLRANPATAGGNIVSTTAVAGADQALAAPTEDDTSTASTPVSSASDLALLNFPSSPTVRAGSGLGNLQFIAVLTNLGPAAATGVEVDLALTLPAGASVLATAPNIGTGENLTWTVGTIGPGVTLVQTVVLTVDAGTSDGMVVASDATVTATSTLTNTADDSDRAESTVMGAPNPDFPAWQAAHFPGGGADAAPRADPDGDGWANFMEFGFGSDPNNTASVPVITMVNDNSSGSTFIDLSFKRRKNLTNLSYIVEVRVDGGPWRAGHDVVRQTAATDPGGEFECVTYRPVRAVPVGGSQETRVRFILRL